MVSHDVFARRLAMLEQWVWDQPPHALAPGRAPSVASLAQSVLELSDLYTTGREESLSQASDRKHLAAKLYYFVFSDAAKVWLVLDELQRRHGAASGAAAGARRGWSIVDAGCGVGATAVGLLLSLDAGAVASVELLGLDHDAAAGRTWLKLATQAAGLVGIDLRARHETRDLSQPADLTGTPTPDLVLAQALLNELPGVGGAAGGAAKMAAWLEPWARRTLVAAIEPALRVSTRPLHEARDLLLRDGGVRALAPCPHQQACPMLRLERDWCHEIRLLPPTPMAEKVQAITNRRDERTKFSFVALSPADRATPREESAVAGVEGGSPDRWGRLVSDALSSKGKVERMLCTGSGELVRVRLLDRERRVGNEWLAEAGRGGLVRIDNAVAWPRIGPEATAKPLDGWVTGEA